MNFSIIILSNTFLTYQSAGGVNPILTSVKLTSELYITLLANNWDSVLSIFCQYPISPSPAKIAKSPTTQSDILTPSPDGNGVVPVSLTI